MKKPSIDTQLMIGIVGGAIASRFVSTKVGDLFPASVPKSFANLIPIALGIYLVGNKNAAMKGAGYGMIASGGSRFAGEMIPAIGKYATVSNERAPRLLSFPSNQAIMSYPANASNMSGVYSDESRIKSMTEPFTRQF